MHMLLTFFNIIKISTLNLCALGDIMNQANNALNNRTHNVGL